MSQTCPSIELSPTMLTVEKKPSMELAPGTLATLYYKANYKSEIYNRSAVATDAPDILAMGEADSNPIGPWSLKLSSSAGRPFKGGWGIRTSDGRFPQLNPQRCGDQ